MKVLHVAQVLKGGIASMLEEIVPHQIARYGAGQVGLVVPESELEPGSPLRAARLWTFPDTARGPRGLMRMHAALARARRDLAPDVEHLHSSHAGLLGRLPGRGAARIVYCPHCWAFSRAPRGLAGALSNRVSLWVERGLAQRTDAVLTGSLGEAEAARVHRIGRDRLRTIANGIADRAPAAAGPARGPLRVVFIGRLAPQKAPERAVRAMAALPPGLARLDMLGDGDRTLLPPLPGNVTLHGWQSRSDVQRAVDRADVILLPSRWEGLSVAALEALRAGKPLLISAEANSRELVRDGVEGRVIASRDAAGFARALRETSRAEWAAMGARARAAFEARFDARKMNAGLDALYAELTGRSVQTRPAAAVAEAPLLPARSRARPG